MHSIIKPGPRGVGTVEKLSCEVACGTQPWFRHLVVIDHRVIRVRILSPLVSESQRLAYSADNS